MRWQWEAIIGWVAVAGVALIIGVFLLSCAAPRVTTETVVPGDPPLCAVEWPKGTHKDFVQTFSIDDRVITVGPAETCYGIH